MKDLNVSLLCFKKVITFSSMKAYDPFLSEASKIKSYLTDIVP